MRRRYFRTGLLGLVLVQMFPQLLAFVEAAQLGEPLERDLVFLAVADEEQGSVLGVRWLMEHRRDVFEGVQYALNEGGITEMTRDRIVYYAIETGGRQVREFRLTADEAESLEELEERWQDLKFAVEMETLLPEIEDYFRHIAPFRRHFGPLIEDIRATHEAGELGQVHPSYLVLLQNNIAFSEIEKLPDGRFERRAVLWYLPGTDPAPLTERIIADTSELGVEAVISPNSSPPIVGFSSVDNSFFELFEQKVHEVYGDQVVVGPMVATKGLTDCRFLRAEGIDCYGIWPFPVSVYDSRGIHSVDERLRLDWFISGIELMTRAVRGWVS
ncbi:MAG: M20/M25/M40 family metallo-hydrolase [Acidobacteria bacterium]|nr:M20/M25/M40 family metallo-hydrolase [Acidobacteriota bacterium]